MLSFGHNWVHGIPGRIRANSAQQLLVSPVKGVQGVHSIPGDRSVPIFFLACAPHQEEDAKRALRHPNNGTTDGSRSRMKTEGYSNRANTASLAPHPRRPLYRSVADRWILVTES